MADAVSLEAQVAALIAENQGLKNHLNAYYGANYALGYRNIQLERLAVTASAVASECAFLHKKVVELENMLAAAAASNERLRRIMTSYLRKLSIKV